MTNAAAQQERALGISAQLAISVQVEAAWGGLQGGAFIGIDQDRIDFPFIDVLGLSSYPFLGGFDDPDSIPLDYYSQLMSAAPLPVLVLEGGWPSISVGPVASTPAEQARYLGRQADLLDQVRAEALFQITVDSALGSKPALATWDSIFQRPLVP